MKNINEKILGLDIGTNTVGTATVKFENGEGKILHLGTRYIPAGGEQYNYYIEGKPLTNNKGQTVSECANRRNFRSQRKGLDRYKKRRDNLIFIFNVLGIKPTGIKYQINYDEKYPNVSILPQKQNKQKLKSPNYKLQDTELYKVYELRNRAINGYLTLNEFGRILYTLNIRRGYQDIGLLGSDNEDEVEVKRLKPNQRITTLKIINATFTNNFKKKKPEFDFIGLENELDEIKGKAFIPYFEKYIGKTLEFILETDKEGSIELKLYKKTEWSKSREENNASLGMKTIGEKLFEEITSAIHNNEKHWNLKLRNKVFDRKYYKIEFDRIWDKQSINFEILRNTPIELLEQIAKALSPKNEAKQKLLIDRGLKWILKEYVIFYQRPLKKGQKDLISKCLFEKDEKRKSKEGKEYIIIYKGIAKSHPAYQEFRIWQTVNNIVIKNNNGDQIFIDQSQYDLLFELMNETDFVSTSDILKKLKLSPKEYFLNYRDEVKIIANKTYSTIKKCFSKDEKEKLNSITNNSILYNHLWHTIYSIPPANKEAKITALTQGAFSLNGAKYSLSISEETAKKLAAVKLEDKYGSLSHKAISKLLPLMRRGKYFKMEQIHKNVKGRISEIIVDGVVDNINPKLLDKVLAFETLDDFSGLRYDEAAEIVYGSHKPDPIIASYNSPEDIQLVKQHSLRHPIVEKIINETLRTIKEIWEDETIGKPTKIAVELARELQNSQKQRENIFKKQISNKAVNDEAKRQLQSDKFNIQTPTLRQIERYKLWEEQKFRCVYTDTYISPGEVVGKDIESQCIYTGTKISEKDLFAKRTNGEYKFDIDHILPRRRLKDDSFSNKVLCLRDANLAKSSKLARTFMESARDYNGLISYEDFVIKVKGLPLEKRTKLLMKDEDLPDDFVQRQLKETQYITRRIIAELSKIVGSENIIFTSGGVTNLLRHEWGVDDIFKRELKERYQKWEHKLNTNGIKKQLVKEDNNQLTINEFSKRIDLRNHALDALVVACTNVKHIQYLNKLNKIYQDEILLKKSTSEGISIKEFATEIISDNGKNKLRFKKPWKNFCADLTKEVKGIIISLKNDREYTNEEGAIKGMLHDQNPIGWRFIPQEAITIRQFIKELKKYKNEKAIGEYLEDSLPFALRSKILDRLTECDFDLKKFEKQIEINPLLDKDNNVIIEITTFKRKLVSRVDLLKLSEKDIKENLIVDKEILEEFKTHISKFKNFTEAFLPENLSLFNIEREAAGKFPVKKLLTRGKEDFDITDHTSNNRIIKRKNSFNKKSVFALKDKAYSIIYEKLDETNERIFKPITLYDFINAKKNGETFVEKIKGYKYLLFDSYNYMYMPEPDEIVNEKTFKYKEKVFRNLYYFKRLSKTDWYFLPHYVNKPLIEKMKVESSEVIIREFGASTEDFVRDLNYNRTIKEHGIPVEIDRVGNIKPIKWEFF